MANDSQFCRIESHIFNEVSRLLQEKIFIRKLSVYQLTIALSNMD